MIPPTIKLGGSRLRPLRSEDAAAWQAYLRDAEVVEFTSYPLMSLDATESMIERCLAGYAAGSSCTWALVQSEDVLVGTCGFCSLSAAEGTAELSYDLAKPYWGHGLMSRAVAACVEWAFAQPEFRQIHAYVMVGNARSEQLLRRAGFTVAKYLKDYRLCRGAVRDYRVFGLERSDWLRERRGRPTRG